MTTDPVERDDVASSRLSRHAGRTAWLMRVAGLAPFVALAVYYLAVPAFREEMHEGFRLLWTQDREGLRTWGDQLGGRAMLATTLMMIGQAIVAPIPAVLITVTNSLLFGWWWGGLLSIASATLAAWLCFVIAKVLGEPVVRKFVSASKLDRSKQFMDQHGAAAVLVARLLPFVPFDPISYLAGLSGMRTWTFVWATFIGQIPAGFAYSYLAHVEEPGSLVFLIPAVLVGLACIGVIARLIVYRRVRIAPSNSGNDKAHSD